MMKQWYETLFENYAKGYDSENYVQGTVGEVDFIEEELGFDKSKNILDIGCGTGRHAIELARRGYKVTGVDLSKAQLERAKERAVQFRGVKRYNSDATSSRKPGSSIPFSFMRNLAKVYPIARACINRRITQITQ